MPLPALPKLLEINIQEESAKIKFYAAKTMSIYYLFKSCTTLGGDIGDIFTFSSTVLIETMQWRLSSKDSVPAKGAPDLRQ